MTNTNVKTQKPAAKTEEIKVSNEGMIEMTSDKVMLQPRTRILFGKQKPEIFFFEPLTAIRKDASSGNDHNTIEHVHQIDANRTASYAPQMPSKALFEESGNAYYKDADEAGDKVESTPKWLAYMPLCNSLFAVLKRKKKPASFTELYEQAVKMCGIKPKYEAEARKVALDALRDMRLVGLAQADMINVSNMRQAKKSHWLLTK